ncbi:MAG: anthranilate synthase component I [Nitrospiraceae bacterium]|nr:MAG: anthranilate synthase component I [Nitrospiraceae bacterium]
MFHPEYKEFAKKAKEGNLVPVYREILADLDTPLSAFLKLKSRRCFLLESVEGGEKWARYSFIGADPSVIIEGSGKNVVVREGKNKKKVTFKHDPLEVLSEHIGKYKPVTVPGLPRFFGGFVGYIGYDTVRFFENLPDYCHEGLHMPDVFLMLTDTLVVFDNLTHKIQVISNAYVKSNPEKAYKKAQAQINKIVKKLRSRTIMPGRGRKSSDDASGFRKNKFRSNFTKKGFIKAVEKTKKYVKSGDVIQTVISQNFEKDTDVQPIHAYRALRVINPSPYMYYLETGSSTIVGSSPEILVRAEGDTLELRPIAGTRRRGKTLDEDLYFEEELKADPKEIAEHIMLVDLGRNDLGRVAETGTVKVTDLMTIERYSHVMHLVTNVRARLKKRKNVFDVLRATFPAGTVSGAPKIRAMEIIEELEPTRRGPYAGSLGYFDFSGNMDMCIIIRTIIFKENKAYIQAGAGIVADSDPEREYKETLNKARGMFRAIEMAEKELS